MVVGKDGLFATDPTNKRVLFVDKNGRVRVVDDKGIEFPNGIALSPDQSLLYVADTRGQYIHSYQVYEDGKLKFKQPFHHLHIQPTKIDSGADGMTVDDQGRLYVSTRMGVQVCDQPGRVHLILSKPHTGWLSNIGFGGPGLDSLYVTCGDRVYRRKINAKGLASAGKPVEPPTPRL